MGGNIASFLKAYTCSHMVRKTQTVNKHVEQVISLLCSVSCSVNWLMGGPCIPPSHARKGLWRGCSLQSPGHCERRLTGVLVFCVLVATIRLAASPPVPHPHSLSRWQGPAPFAAEWCGQGRGGDIPGLPFNCAPASVHSSGQVARCPEKIPSQG